MSDKIRGSIAILFGVFAIVQGSMRMHAGDLRWQVILEVVAGLVLGAIGIWRIRRKPDEPGQEMLK